MSVTFMYTEETEIKNKIYLFLLFTSQKLQRF